MDSQNQGSSEVSAGTGAATRVAPDAAAALAACEAALARARARVLELEEQCENGAASEQLLLDWLTEQGLLVYHERCQRPDGAPGSAWVLLSPAVVNGSAMQAWHPHTAAGALRALLRSRDLPAVPAVPAPTGELAEEDWEPFAPEETVLSDERIAFIGKRALEKCFGTEAQHIYIAREVERAVREGLWAEPPALSCEAELGHAPVPAPALALAAVVTPVEPVCEADVSAIQPWGWHAGDGSPAHPAARVAQWPAHNRQRMQHAVYSEVDALARGAKVRRTPEGEVVRAVSLPVDYWYVVETESGRAGLTCDQFFRHAVRLAQRDAAQARGELVAGSLGPMALASPLTEQLGPALPDLAVPQDWHESSEQKLSEQRCCDGWNACRAEMIVYAEALVAAERERWAPTDAAIKEAVYEQCPDFDEWHEGPNLDDVLAIVRRVCGPNGKAQPNTTAKPHNLK